MPQPRMLLVVTGDDFGYCLRRTRGIVDCFLSGGVSNVSLLVNGAAAQEAAELAKRHNIPMGLHANLTEGRPVCSTLQQTSTLTNQHGFFHGKMGFRQALERGQLSMEQVEAELRAQVRLFVELTGHLPEHMDGHQHVHVLPEVEKDAVESVPVFRRYGIRWPDVYLGLTTMGRHMSVSSLQRALSHALEVGLSGHAPSGEAGIVRPPLTAELMVHPGYPSVPEQGGCGEGPDDFSQSAERLHELHVLRQPAVAQLYSQQGVTLCAFRDL